MQHLQSFKICFVLDSWADVVIFIVLFRTPSETHLHFAAKFFTKGICKFHNFEKVPALLAPLAWILLPVSRWCIAFQI